MKLVPLPVEDRPDPTPAQLHEAEALLRISNAIAAELDNLVGAEHWRDCLKQIRRCGLRGERVQRSGYRPTLEEAD